MSTLPTFVDRNGDRTRRTYSGFFSHFWNKSVMLVFRELKLLNFSERFSGCIFRKQSNHTLYSKRKGLALVKEFFSSQFPVLMSYWYRFSNKGSAFR